MNSQAVTQIGFLVLFIAIMYLLLIRPQRKKEKAVNEMRNSLQVGDEIVTIGGICGKIVKTRPESLVIQVGADKVKFEVMRWGISRVTEQGKPKKAKFEGDEAVSDDEDEKKKSLPKKMKRTEPKPEADEAEPVDFDETADETAADESNDNNDK